MPAVVSVPDVFYGFNSQDPADKKIIEEIEKHRKSMPAGVPYHLVRRGKRAKIGTVFLIPLAGVITVGQTYSAQQLAALLGPGWTAKKIGSKLNTLGRLEKHQPGFQ